MTSEQSNLDKYARMLLVRWRLIGGLAVFFALVTCVAVYMLEPRVYDATAKVIVLPDVDAELDGHSSFWLYRPLVHSDRTLQRTFDRLVRDGVLPEGHPLEPGQHLSSWEERPSERHRPGSVIALTARSPKAATAAAIANTWAHVLIEESRSLARKIPVDSQRLLEEWLVRARRRIHEMESERDRIIERFEHREEETWARWDRRISAEAPERDEDVLRSHRDRELAALARERQEALAQLSRALEPFAALESRAAADLEAALLAKLSERAATVQLAVPAAARDRPVSRRVSLKASLAALVGAMLGVTIVLFQPVGTKPASPGDRTRDIDP